MHSIFKNSYKTGIFAEYYACAYLITKGYRILKTRYKKKIGEIDIIAKRGKTIIFTEVKYRHTLDQAIEAVTPKAQSRIRRASQHYLLGNFDESHTIRFDVIGIDKKFFIRHEENVF